MAPHAVYVENPTFILERRPSSERDSPPTPACLERQPQVPRDACPLSWNSRKRLQKQKDVQTGLLLTVPGGRGWGAGGLRREPVPPANTELCKELPGHVTLNLGLRGSGGTQGSANGARRAVPQVFVCERLWPGRAPRPHSGGFPGEESTASEDVGNLAGVPPSFFILRNP